MARDRCLTFEFLVIISNNIKLDLQNIRNEVNRIQRELDLRHTLCHILRMYIMQLYLAEGYLLIEAACFTANMTGTTIQANLCDSESILYKTSCFLIEKILNSLEEGYEALQEQDWECARDYLEDLAIGYMWKEFPYIDTDGDAVETSSELSRANESNMQGRMSDEEAQILEEPSFLPNESEREEEYPPDNEPMYRAEFEEPHPLQYPVVPRTHRKGSKTKSRHVQNRYAKYKSSKKKRAVTTKKALRSLKKCPTITDSDYERRATMMENFICRQYPTWFKIMKLITRMRKDVKSSEAEMKIILTKHERSLRARKRKLDQALTKNIGLNQKSQLWDKLNVSFFPWY